VVSGDASPVRGLQYAALPWRHADGRVEILLVTTRNTRRWIVPKGGPLAGRTPSESAAQEAFEEAGVLGKVEADAFGTFRYNKRRKSGEVIACKVQVFAMEVERQRRSWAEKAMRETCWCTPEEAVARVSDVGLRRLIAKFAKSSARRQTPRIHRVR
jgi:8-oxo-dGTP pyrophosphatase MutT (NUDIX family)